MESLDKLNKIKEEKSEIRTSIEKKGVSDIGELLGGYPDKIREIKTRIPYQFYSENADNIFSILGSITSIVLPKDMRNVTNMNNAFFRSNISTIDLPDLPNVINMNAIFNSSSIEEVIFKDTTKLVVLSGAFKSTKNLNRVVLYNNLSNLVDLNQCFYLSSIKELVIPIELPKLSTMNYAFYNCPNITKFVVNAPVLKDISNSFMYCSSIEYIDISNSSGINSINSAFLGCSNLHTLLLPDKLPNVTNINSLFSRCANLPNVTNYMHKFSPDKLVSMTSTFLNCTQVTEFLFSDEFINLTSLSNTFNGCSNITRIILNDNMTNLRNLYALCNNCQKLTEIKLPERLDNVNNLGNAFNGCISLSEISLPSSLPLVTSLSSTFLNTKIYKIELPDDMRELVVVNFNYCSNLTYIKMPRYSTKINNGFRMFESLPSLVSVILPEDLSKVTNMNEFIRYTKNIENISGILLLPKVDMSNCGINNNTKLTVDSLNIIINALPELDSGKTLQCSIGSTNLAKLTDEEIAVATNKGWTLV